MSVSLSSVRDPEPFLGQRDLVGLDWHESWDCISTFTTAEDWDPQDAEDLDGELRV